MTCCVSDAILSSSVAWRVKLVACCATRSREESKSGAPGSSAEQIARALRLEVWMRILITSNRGAGHLEPLAPFAQALLRAGDDVLLAAPEGARMHVERMGLPFCSLADPPEEEREAAMADFPRLSNDEQGVIMLRDVFADIYARSSLPGVLRAVDRFAPDMILREPTEFAGLLAAERRGVPHGRIGIWAMDAWSLPLVAPSLDAHRARLGMPVDPRGQRILNSPMLTLLPEALEDPGDPGYALRFREQPPAPVECEPLYVTFGSVMPAMPIFPDVFRATIDALDEVGVPALFTVGVEVDVAALGPVPEHVRIERWVPQAAIMPNVRAMVGHGGSGTTRHALAAGVPSVIFPAFADQPRNAARVAELGAGIALDSLDGLASAIRRVLDEPSYRAAARRVADEIAALPPVDAAPEALRALLAPALAA
jgi:UDP:flavonoid glycosyltransferase YjiC (YdhE family)